MTHLTPLDVAQTEAFTNFVTVILEIERGPHILLIHYEQEWEISTT